MEPLTSNDPEQVGPYRLLGVLGAGGMGVVYLGRAADGAVAAVKVVHRQLAADPGFRQRFARELAVARSVKGSWVAALLDGDAHADRPWLATEYIASPPLNRVVEDLGPPPEPVLATFAHRLVEALAQLHAQGVVHRDLKPSNVLVAKDGPRLIDFGVARAIDATAITQTGMVVGTPAFMSPEQAAGAEVGPPSDVFSLASVLVYAATGCGPFGHTTNGIAMLRRISDDEPDLTGLPAWLRAILEPCFAKDPGVRPSAGELATLLGAGTSPAAGWSPLRQWDPTSVGPYRLLGHLGAGGMGQVFVARADASDDDAAQPLVAVKVVHDQYANDHRFRERFAREIAMVRAVRGPRVVELLDADPDARIPWLATEYIPGPSLEQWVTTTGALPETAALRLAVGLAEALESLHARGVVHRDLKPSNVLLADDGPKLIDFGIARAFDETALTHTGGVLGAPGFMSPEQAAGGDAGLPSDVFSFAAVVVFAVAGHGPFGTSGTPLALLRRVIDDPPDTTGVPARLLQVIGPCFAKSPSDRPTAPEVLSRLASITTALPAPSGGAVPDTKPPVTPSFDTSRSTSDNRGPDRLKRRTLLIAGAAAGLTATGVAGAVLLRNNNQSPPVRAPQWSVDLSTTLSATLKLDSADRPYVATSQNVAALDSSTGETRWTYVLQESFQVTPGGIGMGANTSRCYITDSSDPGLTALDVEDGSSVWSKRYSALVLATNTVTLCMFSQDSGSTVVVRQLLQDRSTGWEFPLGSTRDVITVTGVMATRDYIHLGLEGRFITLDYSGALLWEQPRPPLHSWVTSGEGVFVATRDKVEAFSSRTGTSIWSKTVSPSGTSVVAAIACNSQSVFYADTYALEAWDINTGQQRWRVNQPGIKGEPTSTADWRIRDDVHPVSTADLVFVVERPRSSNTEPYRMSARSAHDGSTLWVTELPELDGEVTLSVGADQLYVMTRGSSALSIHAVSLE